MAGKGGYQRPTSPAPTSGPGALSQRTDGGPGSKQAARYVAGMPYGEGADFMDLQSMAPMEAAQATPSAAGAAQDVRQVAAQGEPIVPINADSMNPDEPVTAGVEAGPGPGSAALPANVQASEGMLKNNPLVMQYLPDLRRVAMLPGTPDSYRRFVNFLERQI